MGKIDVGQIIFDGDYPAEYVYYKVRISSPARPPPGWVISEYIAEILGFYRSQILGFRSSFCDYSSTILRQVSDSHC